MTFYHGPFEVGIFTADSPPREPGVHEYVPIEGDGHDEVQRARRSGAEPRCHFDADGIRTSFAIRSSPRFGRFELVDFETGPTPSD